jgi:predicted nuclease with TOPRIM domain
MDIEPLCELLGLPQPMKIPDKKTEFGETMDELIKQMDVLIKSLEDIQKEICNLQETSRENEKIQSKSAHNVS